jgi:hypothetical protein
MGTHGNIVLIRREVFSVGFFQRDATLWHDEVGFVARVVEVGFDIVDDIGEQSAMRDAAVNKVSLFPRASDNIVGNVRMQYYR